MVIFFDKNLKNMLFKFWAVEIETNKLWEICLDILALFLLEF